MDRNKFEKAMEDMLTAIYGERWREDDNFIETPKRMTNAYYNFLVCEDPKILNSTVNEIFSKTFPANNGITPASQHLNMIFANNISAVSVCPHHFLPVRYTINTAYIPSKAGRVIGASKLERLARTLASRAILQEDFTEEFVDTVENALQPEGVAIVVSGKHSCMTDRGIKTKGTFDTSAMRGAFYENDRTREEFFNLLKISLLRN